MPTLSLKNHSKNIAKNGPEMGNSEMIMGPVSRLWEKDSRFRRGAVGRLCTGSRRMDPVQTVREKIGLELLIFSR